MYLESEALEHFVAWFKANGWLNIIEGKNPIQPHLRGEWKGLLITVYKQGSGYEAFCTDPEALEKSWNYYLSKLGETDDKTD